MMNPTKHIAAQAYKFYMQEGKGQMSPEDALWFADQYLEENPDVSIEDAIQSVKNSLLYND